MYFWRRPVVLRSHSHSCKNNWFQIAICRERFLKGGKLSVTSSRHEKDLMFWYHTDSPMLTCLEICSGSWQYGVCGNTKFESCGNADHTTIAHHNTAQVGMPLLEESVDGNAFSSLVSANFLALEELKTYSNPISAEVCFTISKVWHNLIVKIV